MEQIVLSNGNKTSKLANVSSTFTFKIAAGTFIDKIFFSKVSGTPLLSLGTTLGGTDLVNAEDLAASDPPIKLEKYFKTAATLYAVIAGGVANIRIDTINNTF